ncbi:MAG: hypothetical protein K6G39_01145 [Bacteroidales bacterium]|nr:hypothetical protein [Bacteroidales bacterium]
MARLSDFRKPALRAASTGFLRKSNRTIRQGPLPARRGGQRSGKWFFGKPSEKYFPAARLEDSAAELYYSAVRQRTWEA